MAGAASGCCFSANLSTTHRHFLRFHPAAAGAPAFVAAVPTPDYSGGRLVSSSPFPSSSSSCSNIGVFSLAPATAAAPLVRHLSPSQPDGVVPLSKRFISLIVGCSGNGDGGLGSHGGGDGAGGGGAGGGGGEGDGQGGEESSSEKNRLEALLALSQAERSLESIPKDLAAAIQEGRIPGVIVERFFELEKSPLLGWLLRFAGFKERLLADDLFLAKVAMECGVGIFTKRNGAKLFVVGTSASLLGTGITNVLINTRKAFDKDFAGEAEDVPILSTSAAYGLYMAVSSNLRYQVLAGVIEQRILEPLLHNQKLVLSALCFTVRTGNTFLGSLLWVDYARWVGVQKVRE